MPKNPLAVFNDAIEKGLEIHSNLERLRSNLDSIDPVQKIGDTVDSITQKVNRLDSVLVKTKRRPRQATPKQSPPSEE